MIDQILAVCKLFAHPIEERKHTVIVTDRGLADGINRQSHTFLGKDP